MWADSPTQVLCVRDMLQHCDAVLLLDNDSLLKQAATKQLKPAPGAVGGGGGGAAACVSMTLSDANKVLPQQGSCEMFHLTPSRLQRRLLLICCAILCPCR